jgi:hypothetical protein
MRLSAVLWKAGREFFRSHPCDLIAFYSPTIFFGPLVRRLKELWNCRSYMILRDIFPQWAVDAGALRKGPSYLFFKRPYLRGNCRLRTETLLRRPRKARQPRDLNKRF